MFDINDVSGQIVNCAFRIHFKLGPGLFESVYETILARDLAVKGLKVERQKRIPLEFEGLTFDEAFRADLVVHECIIVEVKSVPELADVHFTQVATYLRLMDYRLGLILNFGAPLMKDGIKRIANRL